MVKVRAQMSMIFHLDKCIGCNTCSVACKNLWTDRQGTEYMWWNNVEAIPGTGYPAGWEDQEHYRGGWELKAGKLKLKLHSRLTGMANLFFNPVLPTMDDYYEPFTFSYENLFDAPEGDDQPTAIPISLVSGKPLDIKSGPNWDDDLGGSDIYARNDPSLEELDREARAWLDELESVVMQYLPRICNHCLNPSCVAACPSGAIYKRAEDGVVLVDQNQCRAWRMCISGCPYKKVYYNWSTGKSEKCILCFPRLETGQAPACAHTCVGRLRYLGPLLYDADQIPQAALVPDEDLVDAQVGMLLDPFDPEVIAAARASGLEDSWIEAAQRSPADKLVRVWRMALPLHPEFRTMAMIFYLPPLSPLVSVTERDLFKLKLPPEDVDFELLSRLDDGRMPTKYLATLFCGGNEALMRGVLKKMLAVRQFKRRQSVAGDLDTETLDLIAEVGSSPQQMEEIYHLTTLASFEERFVVWPYHREKGVEDPRVAKGAAGLGYSRPARRGA
jgi:nitrate reductase beta subunit